MVNYKNVVIPRKLHSQINRGERSAARAAAAAARESGFDAEKGGACTRDRRKEERNGVEREGGLTRPLSLSLSPPLPPSREEDNRKSWRRDTIHGTLVSGIPVLGGVVFSVRFDGKSGLFGKLHGHREELRSRAGRSLRTTKQPSTHFAALWLLLIIYAASVARLPTPPVRRNLHVAPSKRGPVHHRATIAPIHRRCIPGTDPGTRPNRANPIESHNRFAGNNNYDWIPRGSGGRTPRFFPFFLPSPSPLRILRGPSSFPPFLSSIFSPLFFSFLLPPFISNDPEQLHGSRPISPRTRNGRDPLAKRVTLSGESFRKFAGKYERGGKKREREEARWRERERAKGNKKEQAARHFSLDRGAATV